MVLSEIVKRLEEVFPHYDIDYARRVEVTDVDGTKLPRLAWELKIVEPEVNYTIKKREDKE